jgi:hypothetical protein
VLVVYGLHTRPSALDDTIQVPKRRVISSRPVPGHVLSTGERPHQPIIDRSGVDANCRARSSSTHLAASCRLIASSCSGHGESGRQRFVDAELRVINGLSWPQTERFSYTVGDTVRWRWVN